MEEKLFIPYSTTVRRKISIRDTISWLVDWLDILFIITPLLISFWRGSVELLLSVADPFWFWIMTIVGCSVQTLFYMGRTYCAKSENWYVVNVYIFAGGCTAHWSGVWGLLDIYCGPGYEAAVFCLTLTLLVLGMSRLLRNISGAPFDFVADNAAENFQFPTLFQTEAQIVVVSTNQGRCCASCE